MKSAWKIGLPIYMAGFTAALITRKSIKESLYSEARWAASPIGDCGTGGQSRPARCRVTILNQIYEEDSNRGFSYGFRSGRSQHQALDALSVGILAEEKVSQGVLDADI